MTARIHLAFGLALALSACGHSGESPSDGATVSPTDAAARDAAGNADLAGPYPRTLLMRPLMPTSPENLLRDPFISGEAKPSFGQFRAFFVGGDSIAMSRTFQSVSPVGGAVSIEELRGLPMPANPGTARVMASFTGGAGMFQGAIWLSVGDGMANPVPFAGAAASIEVTLLGNDGTVKSTLAPAAQTVKYGSREWVRYTTPGGVALPMGGWLSISLTDLSRTLQLTAPEVISSAIAGSPAMPHGRPILSTLSDDDRRALAQARQWDRLHPGPLRPHEHNPTDR